ncbi:MAG: trimeric intracellular cation channel family protein [Prevotellaceae bacterium]|nr:trimeric intracellular cation channel family protein [Candidatus Faecinaster equi]
MILEFPTFFQILDYIGTLAFAISGTRLAASKHFDIFGAYIVGVTTAIGGGTMRDILLGQTPFWMMHPGYLVFSAIAVVWTIVFRKQIVHQIHTWFIFDTIGLALFTVTGIEKTLDQNYPYWLAIIMGTMTGAAGGIMRDVLINEVPLIFRKEIYAFACIAGGIIFYLCSQCGTGIHIAGIACAITVIIIRIVAVKYKFTLPKLKVEDNTKE